MKHIYLKKTITKYFFDYRNTNNNVLSPENIIAEVGIQISDSSFREICRTPWLAENYEFGFNNNHHVKGLYSYTFPNPVDISGLHHVGVGYLDIYGNFYSLNWIR